MPSVRFVVEFSPVDNPVGFGADGSDVVRFLMSANAGENPGRISRIASGGELSRIMLALKNVFAEHDPVQTMIFDEIDTGVSGVAAQRVAEKLYAVSGNKQVMCVTHLPQIAAMADIQYLVSKSESSGRTFTQVTALDPEGRKREIARLFGGDHITEVTLAAASEQLDAAEHFKKKTKGNTQTIRLIYPYIVSVLTLFVTIRFCLSSIGQSEDIVLNISIQVVIGNSFRY